MKVLVDNYTFDASAKTVTFDDHTAIALERVLLITNSTDGIIIFLFADPALKGSVATNVLTLDHDTTAMADTDDLQIWYWDDAPSRDMEGGGKVAVGTTAVEATFTGAPKEILITADPDNTGYLYVGKSNVTSAGANALCILLPGSSVRLDYTDEDNAVYVVGSAASQNFWKGALL